MILSIGMLLLVVACRRSGSEAGSYSLCRRSCCWSGLSGHRDRLVAVEGKGTGDVSGVPAAAILAKGSGYTVPTARRAVVNMTRP